jgi:hypothetical protein
MHDLTMAFRLASYGRENKMPEAMIVAARIVGTSASRDFEVAEGKVDAADQFDAKKYAVDLIDDALKMDGVSDAVKQLGLTTKQTEL